MTAHQIQAAALTTFDVASDGSHVRMHMRDQEGQPASLILPATCLNQLLMTLPAMVQSSLRRRHGDDSARLVHPINACKLESGENDSRGVPQLILTMSTGDGFTASYAAPASTLASIARTILEQVPDAESEARPRLLS